MKELEGRINKILDNMEWCHYGIDGRSETELLLTKEVKDIAIEFLDRLRDYERESHTLLGFDERTSEELFNQFIKEKYGTPETH